MDLTMQHTQQLTNLAETQALAHRVANLLILTGELGAGKTTFTQALAKTLGITEPITSPTFVVARHHNHPDDGLNLVHVDAYRITGADELASLDLESWLQDSVVVIEWGRRTAEDLSDSILDIELIRPGATAGEIITDFSNDEVDEPRTAIITGHGPRWEGISIT